MRPLHFLPLALAACAAHAELQTDVVCALVDGAHTLSNALFTGADKTLIELLAPEGHTPAVCNAFLLDTHGKKALIDTGRGGDLQAGLKAAGVAPGEIEAVLLTHSHADHVGGLLAADGKTAAFPNATVHITSAELDFWRASRPENAAACEAANTFALITPDGETPVLPGVVALDAAGHTPGHAAFLVDGTHLVAGDLLHSGLLQFSHPEICASFDNDKEAAVAARKKILGYAAGKSEKTGRPFVFMASHIKEFGLIKEEDGGFRLAPPD